MDTATDRGQARKNWEDCRKKMHGLSHDVTGRKHSDEDTVTILTASSTGPQGYRGKYSGTPQSATQARHDVEMILSTWHMERINYPAAQIIAELMANAVSHCASAPVVMEMMRTDQGVRICVVDSCHREPVPKEVAPTDESGRGMLIIAAFASAWDWEFVRVGRRRKTIGKRVWADLAL